MLNHAALLRAYEGYARALLQTYDIGEMLYRLTDQVVEVLEIDGAGVVLADDDDQLALVSTTDKRVATLQELQLENGRGPSIQAFHDNAQVASSDLAADDRWPELAAAARDQGLAAVAGLPMPVHEQRIGALDLWTVEPHDWTDEELRVGQVLANMASGYVLNNLELSESRDLAQQLQHALDSRVIVEQAKGIVAGKLDITPSDAFGLLRRHARSTSTKLHHVCQRIVDGDLDL
ncbi:GAF and ANTAR domain-containing protein [Salsipaludibacter albus]|uniref:GAF and ANTAR domain-containing protein n=1 Tax=Salsipaludibacter albus TaxID=2849650 RepID=UPI001EE4BECF|nr:GAF and ANTAR domain-containing protein [Salsipaludibacter albus]MBY5163191.1 GAF and ANTAR domain-containing protein [Salsipaludibacter albus]